MSNSVQLDDELIRRLRARAQEQGVGADELAREILREVLETPDERFERIAAYIVDKNRELYRRLS